MPALAATVAAQLAPGANFAADDAFETADGYAFDAERLGAAHAGGASVACEHGSTKPVAKPYVSWKPRAEGHWVSCAWPRCHLPAIAVV